MNTKTRGFTLIELVVVIVILGILSAVALPRFVNIGADARVAVMQSAAGSMRATNAMIYAKAATAGVQGSASGVVTINGATVNTAYGFAKTVDPDLKAVMDLQPTGDFTTTGTLLEHAKAQSPTSCAITYTAATATAVPGYDITLLTSTNCS